MSNYILPFYVGVITYLGPNPEDGLAHLCWLNSRKDNIT